MHTTRQTCLALTFSLFATLAFAQAQKAPAYEPQSGQEGKDVVWIPSPMAVSEKMLEIAKVTPNDFVMDLGSGDGRTVIAAAKRGARAMGVEYNPQMVEYSKRLAEKEGVSGKATFVKQDLFETDLSQATVITMFLLPDINVKLRPKILDLKPGTRIVSNSFSMGDWKEDDRVEVPGSGGCNSSWCTVLFWVVPARIAGSHKLPQGDLVLKQEYQMLTGSFRTGGNTYALEGKVRGEEFSFTAGGKTYRGKANGKSVQLL
jgi:SAM-dependent methyltransferase